jgi:hypothetical protein
LTVTAPKAGLEAGRADLIAFGRKFIANPDLPQRLRDHAELNCDDRTTYYGGRCERLHRLQQPGAGARRDAAALRRRELALAGALAVSER